MKIRIGGIVDISTVDWVGKPTTMLFLAGCSFACPWCHNANLIPLESGRLVSVSDVKERISKNLGFIDGIGFSGGEPTIQEEAVIEISDWAKDRGLGVFLNTNGSNPRVVQKLARMDLLDEVASDVKAPLVADEYSRVIGKSSSYCSKVVMDVSKTLSVCSENDIPIEIRTTIIPSLMDRPDQIQSISRISKGCERFILQQFVPNENVPNPTYRLLSSPSREHLICLARVALGEGVGDVFIRSTFRGLERVDS